MKIKFWQKFLVIVLCSTMLLGFAGVPYKAKASWPDVANMVSNWMDDPLNTFGWEEIKALIMDSLKKWAMNRFRKKVYELVGESGGLVENYGKYIFGSGDSHAARYWNSFISNCTNIDASVSLAITNNVAAPIEDRYDWCPVKVNVRGVDLGNIELKDPSGWEDWNDAWSWGNSPASQYTEISRQVEEARRQTEEAKKAQLTNSGVTSVTEGEAAANDQSQQNAGQQTASGDGKTEMPAQADPEDIDRWGQQFLDILNVATAGTFEATSNINGFLSSLVTLALNYFADEVLSDTAFGEFL